MKTTISHTAGHSLGEYSALYASGVFDFSTGLKLVKKRAEFIQSVSEKNKGAMAAVIGLTQEQVQQVCKEVTAQGTLVEPVNYNSNEQTVISGTVAGVEKAVELAKQIAGTNKLFKTVVLNVSGAFHSSLMKEAADNMGKELSGTVLSDAKIPVISNYDGTGTVNAGEIKSKLEKQINHAVLWVQAINNLAGLGVDTVVELGPGKVLSGLVKRINRNISIYNIEDTVTLGKTMEGLIKQESTL
jgi:[acyl-carrier-protein] S-malonyltransferase